MSRLERLFAVACLLAGVSRGAAAEKPLVVRALPGAEAVPVRLPDGVLQVYYLQTGGERESIAAIASTDGGRTWGPPVTVLPIEGRHRVVRALVADDGEVHLFLLKWRDGHRFLDVWHVRSREGRRRWGEPARIFEGYVGSLRGAAQLRGGRILLPIHYRTDRSWRNRGEGLAGFLYKGQFDITALHTDDGGASWRRSPARLTVPAGAIPDQGGVEPVVLELRDGRIWMLIRSQRGLLYESFSRDGVAWTEPQPSRFVGSDSPAALARLRDGRIVVAWNGCQRYPYAMGGRQVLHAAISEDEGKTWRGFREVYRDPARDQPPPRVGDYGTGYPAAVEATDGRLLLATGQGPSGALILVDCAWLYERRQVEDFGNGLDAWSVFGTRGVSLAPHPVREGARVLALDAPDPEWTAAAVWNFPSGRRGRLRLRLLATQAAGPLLSLTDHFSVPFDDEAELESLWSVRLAEILRAGAWHDLEIEWDVDTGGCRLRVDGADTGVLRAQRRATEGASYLRLRLPAAEGPRLPPASGSSASRR